MYRFESFQTIWLAYGTFNLSGWLFRSKPAWGGVPAGVLFRDWFSTGVGPLNGVLGVRFSGSGVLMPNSSSSNLNSKGLNIFSRRRLSNSSIMFIANTII